MDMDMEVMSSVSTGNRGEDDEVAVLPGFRFHPTDEELVGFYLKRKVEKKPISIELIKQIDIYKFDPWDLPKASNVGDKEWYFFCKRGRKYRNSIRPNRVTGSGFWKATGIDRPIYSAAGQGRDCIGLKKSLVYYRGSAGKGTKTDWMMHEFRLPSEHDRTNTKQIDAKTIAQEAEVWTLCRIFKRNVSYRKCIPDWKEYSSAAGGNYKQRTTNIALDASSKTGSLDFDHYPSNRPTNYISFSSTSTAAAIPSANNANRSNNNVNVDQKPYSHSNIHHGHVDAANQQQQQVLSSSSAVAPPMLNNNNIAPYNGSLGSAEFSEMLKHGDWDELRTIFESAAAAAAPMFM